MQHGVYFITAEFSVGKSSDSPNVPGFFAILVASETVTKHTL